MEKKINKYKSISHKCNVLTNLLNPTKRAKSKYDHYSPILQGCTNTRSGRAKFINFQIILDRGSSSKIVMGNMASKTKQKAIRNIYVGNPSSEVHDLKEGEHRFLPARIKCD